VISRELLAVARVAPIFFHLTRFFYLTHPEPAASSSVNRTPSPRRVDEGRQRSTRCEPAAGKAVGA
jgi:hypothetical protein